jgi:plastocyanin
MQRLFASLLIATTGVIGLFAFALPTEAGGGGHGGCVEAPREGANEPVAIRNSCFTPAVLYVEAGATVTWTNQDEMGHNVILFSGQRLGEQKPFFQGDGVGFLKGESISHTFEAPGLYAYYCSIHPSMLAVVAVGDPASFAATQQSQQPEPSPPIAPDAVAVSSHSGLTPLLAGLILGVGLVSAGGGYLLRRRAA